MPEQPPHATATERQATLQKLHLLLEAGQITRMRYACGPIEFESDINGPCTTTLEQFGTSSPRLKIRSYQAEDIIETPQAILVVFPHPHGTLTFTKKEGA